jgi:hypothetical protein
MAGTTCFKAFTAFSPSHWVHAIGLNCDGAIWVWFNHGQRIILRLDRGPGRYVGIGGAPAVCCLYPNTAGGLGQKLYQFAQAWAFAGEFEHSFLYRTQAYRIIAPPTLPCAGCGDAVGLTSSANPTTPGTAVTFTCTVANTSGALEPTGGVTFSINGTAVGTVALSGGQAALTHTFTARGSYTVVAQYTADPGWQSGQAVLTEVVGVSAVVGGSG